VSECLSTFPEASTVHHVLADRAELDRQSRGTQLFGTVYAGITSSEPLCYVDDVRGVAGLVAELKSLHAETVSDKSSNFLVAPAVFRPSGRKKDDVYLPCQAKVAADSFFHEYTDEGRELLKVDSWLRHEDVEVPDVVDLQPELQPEPDTRAEGDGVVDDLAVERAVAAWRSAPPSTGNAAFFRLGLTLRRAGLELREVEQTLRSEAAFARKGSERERLAGVDNVIKWLREHPVSRPARHYGW
jgi:hypothetical protein